MEAMMLQLKGLKKTFKTGELTQVALDGVSLNLRDNEFVAILGPSGSGKTTLLNMIGGLDRYDSGDLIINGISTKKYKDRDWDSYRNHTIGFVFQSYNLIPHQSILANVELALTLSGVSKKERRDRAIAALTQVGLAEHINKNIYDADIVVFDDIATKGITQFEAENLFSIIDTRMNMGKSNVFTSNIIPAQLNDLLGPRLTSRIINLSTVIQFRGRDKRGAF